MLNLKEIEFQMNRYKDDKDLVHLAQYAQLLLDESLKQNNKYYQVIANYHIASGHYQKGEFNEALKIVLNTLQLCKFIDHPFYEMVLNNLAGVLYGSFSDEITSIEYTLKAYYIALNHPELDYIYIIENNLGVLFFNLNIYEIAYDYFLKSIERRNINDYENMRERDGFNIINIVGCCMKMKHIKEYKKWIPYLDYYLEKYDNQTVKDDYLLYQIYQSFYEHNESEIYEKVLILLDNVNKNADKLHTLKNLNDVFKICIEIENKTLCENVYHKMQEIIKEYPDYKYISRLNDYLIQMSITFQDDRVLYQALYDYYVDKKKEDERWRQNLRKSLITKIELEETLYQQKEIVKKNEELMKNNEIEDFTKVLNKTAFKKHVEEELKYFKDDQYMAMFVIDLDKFKSINDNYGHLSGDQLLLDVVDILKLETREIDYIGRIGGDEFCIFMKNILSLPYIEEKALMLLKSIQAIKINNIGIDMTVSIGIQVISKAWDYNKLFKEADRLMYCSKTAGGNRYTMKVDESID